MYVWAGMLELVQLVRFPAAECDPHPELHIGPKRPRADFADPVFAAAGSGKLEV